MSRLASGGSPPATWCAARLCTRRDVSIAPSITPAHYPGGAMLGRRASRLRPLRHPGAWLGIPISPARPVACAPKASKMDSRTPSDGLSTPACVSAIPKIPVNKRICLRTRSP